MVRVEVVEHAARLAKVKADLALEVEEHRLTRAELEGAQGQLRRLTKEVGAVKNNENAELTRLQRQLQEMQKKWKSEEEWRSAEAQLQEGVLVVKALRDDLLSKTSQLAALRRDKEGLESRYQGTLRSMSALEVEAKHLREEVQRSAEEARRRGVEAEAVGTLRAVAEREVEVLARKLKELETPKQSLEAGAQTDSSWFREALERAGVEAERARLEAAMAAVVDDAAAAGREAERAKEKLDKARKKAKALQKQLEERDSPAVAEARAEEERWRVRVAELAEGVAAAEGRAAAADARATAGERALADARAAAAASTADVLEAVAERDRLDKAYWELKEQLDTRLNELNQSGEALRRAEAQLEELAIVKQALGEVRLQAAKLKSQHADALAEAENLQVELARRPLRRPTPKLSLTRAFAISCPDVVLTQSSSKVAPVSQSSSLAAQTQQQTQEGNVPSTRSSVVGNKGVGAKMEAGGEKIAPDLRRRPSLPNVVL